MDFDIVIKNATIVTAAEVLPHNLMIGVKASKISCIAQFLEFGPNTTVIDAEGAYVTPGGVDSHVHLDQDNSPTGDKWLTGSRSALAGGNTTIIAFASQKRSDESLFPVVEDYHNRSRGQSYVDYGFHLILTNPSEKILKEELPVMVEQGITSVKLYMTYPAMKLGDAELLDVMMRTKELGMTTMVHAENSDMIDMIINRLVKRKHTDPKFHANARPQVAEAEATSRVISLSTLTNTPILIVHMSARVALDHARDAQKALLPIHVETCPHYLHLLSSKLAGESDQDHWDGAKHVCAPPLRHSEDDLQHVWNSVNNGTITVISSDHAPSQYAHDGGKRKPLVTAATQNSVPTFAEIPNGLPGIETRLPLLFDAATNDLRDEGRKVSLPKYVSLTSTNPAKMYGLDGVKGSVAVGYDADLVIWYPPNDARGRTVIQNEELHHCIDYTPFEGIEVCNWPRWVLLRGKVVWSKDKETQEGKGAGILGSSSEGVFLHRQKGKVLVGRTGQLPIGMVEGERALWMA